MMFCYRKFLKDKSYLITTKSNNGHYTCVVLIMVIVGLFTGGCVQTSKNQTEGEYNPVINPSNFVSVVDNPYIALIPGTSNTYQGKTGKGIEKNIVMITNQPRKYWEKNNGGLGQGLV